MWEEKKEKEEEEEEVEIVLEFDSYSVPLPDPKSSTSPLSGEFLCGSQIKLLKSHSLQCCILHFVNTYMEQTNVWHQSHHEQWTIYTLSFSGLISAA